MKSFLRITSIVAIVIAIATVAAIYISTFNDDKVLNKEELLHPMLERPDYADLKTKDEIYTKKGILKIGGRQFEIPISYVDGSFKDGVIEDDVVLKYVLPDFKSTLEYRPHTPERRELLNQGLISGMLLEDAASRPPLEKSIENVMRNRGYQRIIDNLYGLEKYSSSPQGANTRVPDDRLIERNDNGEVISYFRCSPPDKDLVPSCNHVFWDKGLAYRIRWPIRELPNWREQRDKAIKFIDQHEIIKG